jgi:BMFP domain-containing protein YqiC
MTTASTRFFDELAKMMTNAAGAAQGVRREVDTLVKAQVERILGDLDVVQREEFEAVREMAQKARTENERLMERIAELERRLSGAPAEPVPAVTVASMSAPPAEPAAPPPSSANEPPTA